MEIRLKDLFKVLLQKWLFVVITVLVFAMAGLFTSKFIISKKYISESQAMATSYSLNNNESSRLSEQTVSET